MRAEDGRHGRREPVRSYVLITPARDEADNLRRLATCLIEQRHRPEAWIVVDDGSTDETVRVMEELTLTQSWIRLIESPGVRTRPGSLAAGRGAGRDIVAFNAGIEALQGTPDVVVKLDADVSVEPDFFERLLAEFDADPRLGIAGGECYELRGGAWEYQAVTGGHVRGATRAYRWECFADVRPLEERLGWDGIDALKAIERGWRVGSIAGLPFKHHRPVGDRERLAFFKWAGMGRAAHYMGYRFTYLLLRTLHRMRRDASAVGLLWGYTAAALRRESRFPDLKARTRLRRDQRLRNLPQRIREARRSSTLETDSTATRP